MESKAWLNNGIVGFPGMAKKGTLSLANGVVKFQKKNGETVFEAPTSSIEVNPKTFWRWNMRDLLLKIGDNTYYLSFNSPWLRGNAGMNIYGLNKLDLRKQWVDAIASGNVPAAASTPPAPQQQA